MKTNVTLKLKQKNFAISLLQKLDIDQSYVDIFKNEDIVTYFTHYIGFWAYQNEELIKKVKELEKEYGCLVYAITHEFTEFEECYSMLIVSKYKSEWKLSFDSEGRNHYAFAYVWNKTDDDCSEFGTVVVKSALGGITRIA